MMLSPEERDRMFRWAAHQLWWQNITSTQGQAIQSLLLGPIAPVRTWEQLLTRDDRDFLRSIRVKADA